MLPAVFPLCVVYLPLFAKFISNCDKVWKLLFLDIFANKIFFFFKKKISLCSRFFFFFSWSRKVVHTLNSRLINMYIQIRTCHYTLTRIVSWWFLCCKLLFLIWYNLFIYLNSFELFFLFFGVIDVQNICNSIIDTWNTQAVTISFRFVLAYILLFLFIIITFLFFIHYLCCFQCLYTNSLTLY